MTDSVAAKCEKFHIVVMFLLCIVSISQASDKIILKNGNIIEGRIVREKSDQVTIELMGGKGSMGIPRSDILRIIMEKPESFLKAEGAFEKREFKEAIKLYNEVVSEYGRTEWGKKALIGVGRSYMELKKVDEACRIFERFLSRYKDSDLSCEVGLILGEIFTGKEMYDRAKTVYGEILEKSCPGEYLAEAQFRLGEIYSVTEEYEEALMSLLRVVVVFSEESDLVQKAMLRSGSCYEKLEDSGNARGIYEELLREYPKGKYVKEAKKKLNELGDELEKGEKR